MPSGQQVPTALKGDASVVLAYARQLRAIGRDDLAEEVLHITLNRQWDERLVELYGQLRPRDASRPLHHAEGWLKDRPQDAVLLLALAVVHEQPAVGQGARISGAQSGAAAVRSHRRRTGQGGHPAGRCGPQPAAPAEPVARVRHHFAADAAGLTARLVCPGP